jgi:2-phosphosulfolactate phosphatase
MTPFSQEAASCRCEWGAAGIAALAPAEVLIIVDVLSFSTCVDIALSRGAAILPYAWNDSSAAEFAVACGAELAGRRKQAKYSLAPESYLTAPAGLRCVLPSPNGSQLTLQAARGPGVVFTGCLRNAAAVAGAAERCGTSFNVIAAGEHWSDDILRPALEDLLGAGAILQSLPGTRSPEAEAAVAVFERFRTSLTEALGACGSGRELAGRGHDRDKLLASELNVSACAPRFNGEAYVAA